MAGHRFAHDHPPDPPPRSFWILAAALFLLLAVPVALINLAVDPFDFRLAPHLPLVRDKLMRKNNTMLWAAGEFRRIPKEALDQVTIIAVGDSRTELLCGGRANPRVFRVGSDVMCNLAIGGASFQETILSLEEILPRAPNLKAVILGLPIERIGVCELDRAKDSFNQSHSPLFYLLNLKTLGFSIELLADPASRVGLNIELRPEATDEYIVDKSDFYLNLPRRMEALKGLISSPLIPSESRALRVWKSAFKNADEEVASHRFEEIVFPLIKQLRISGVDVIFFLPPLHPEVIASLSPKSRQLQEWYRQKLLTFGSIEDFSVGNQDGLPLVFADGSHVQQPVAQAMFSVIYFRNLQGKR